MNKKGAVALIGACVLSGGYFAAQHYADKMAAQEVDSMIGQLSPHWDVAYDEAKVGFLNQSVTLTDVSITPLGLDHGVHIAQLNVSGIDLSSPIPKSMKLQLQGISSKDPELLQLANHMGFEQIPSFDLNSAYQFDADSKIFTLEQFTLRSRDLGEINLAYQLRDVPTNQHTLLLSYPNVKLVSASLSYQDASLMNRLLQVMADEEGISISQLKDYISQRIDNAITIEDKPVSNETLQALKGFVHDGGTLRLSIDPAQPLSVGELMRLKGDPALVSSLNMSLTKM